jgi:hypothetical protein
MAQLTSTRIDLNGVEAPRMSTVRQTPERGSCEAVFDNALARVQAPERMMFRPALTSQRFAPLSERAGMYRRVEVESAVIHLDCTPP